MMGALYSGAIGMKTLSTGMQTVSNNLANVSTVGYRQQQMLYSDMVSNYAGLGNSSGTSYSQVGAGVMPGAIRTIHNQGGYEQSNSVTDMSINNGKGFFGVTRNGETHYTKAGNFNFNKNGELLDPSGWNVLGLPIVNGVKAQTAVPIKLDLAATGMLSSIPHKATSKINSVVNLGSTESKTNDTTNPYFAMLGQWDGRMANNAPKGAYVQPLQAYDNLGNLQTLNITYDHATTNNGSNTYEFLVTMNPAQDGSAYAGQVGAGALMSGTLTFDSAGKIVGMTAYTPQGDPSNLANWYPAALGADGTPVLTATFAGAGAQNIEIDLGIKAPNGWANNNSAATVGNTPATLAQSVSPTVSTSTTTGYAGNTSTGKVGQDGYAEGFLGNVLIGKDGTITGTYSNGQQQDLYQIPLFRFTSDDGLRREGSNHYSAPKEAGKVEMGEAGTENYGAINSNTLETSNVDMATEFAHMIITQRAFQSNSKMVTTADALLQKALELKR